jgi:hypothetical protein
MLVIIDRESLTPTQHKIAIALTEKVLQDAKFTILIYNPEEPKSSVTPLEFAKDIRARDSYIASQIKYFTQHDPSQNVRHIGVMQPLVSSVNSLFTIAVKKPLPTTDTTLILSSNQSFLLDKMIISRYSVKHIMLYNLTIQLDIQEKNTRFINNLSDLDNAQKDTDIDFGVAEFAGIFFFKKELLKIKQAIAVSNIQDEPKFDFGLFKIAQMPKKEQKEDIDILLKESAEILRNQQAY